MDVSIFTYQIYIQAPKEKIWQGLTDPQFTVQYWGHYNISDWKVGTRWEHQRPDRDHTVDIAGEIIACEPPGLLVHGWTFTGSVHRARVTFEINEVKPGITKLTLTHENLEHDIEREVWPKVLSGLKTLLETGQAIPGLM